MTAVKEPTRPLEAAEVVRPSPRRFREPALGLSDREWEWLSGPCTAADHSFEVRVEKGCGFAGQMRVVTSPLRDRSASQAESTYHVLRRDNPWSPYGLFHDGECIALTGDASGVLRFLTWHINRTMIGRTSRRRVVLHAAAARRAGITLILPAAQESGKTTTVAGLLREGYEYITDEAVVLDPTTLRVTPYPKALSLDDGSWELFPWCRPAAVLAGAHQWQVPAYQLGGHPVRHATAPPRLVVFPHYVAGSRTRLERITPGAALRELVSTTFHFEDDPARNLRVLAQISETAVAGRLTIGSLDQAVMEIERLVSELLMKGL